MAALEESIREFSQSLGFSLAGIAPAVEADGFSRLQEWLDRDYAGEMEYMRRRVEPRRHPKSILAEVRSVIMVAMDYATGEVVEQDADPVIRTTRSKSFPTSSSVRIARYAAGRDYHEVMWEKLNKLLAWLQTEVPESQGRGVVDTAPLLERDFARRAGLGWIGKNTMLINKQRGSYFFLGALLTNLDLKTDPPHEPDHCGTCTACLDACPTQAFTGPGWLDARKCISYLTIELRNPIPKELRPGIGDWAFGCDVCQEVCPWNHPDETKPLLVDAIELLSLDEAAFRKRFRGTAIVRTKRRGLLRNAAIALGNMGDERAIPALERAMNDAEPMVREAACWALNQIRTRVTSIQD